MKTKTVLIVDDHPLMRTALRITLEDVAGLVVAGEADTLAEGRQKVLALNPDLILLDLYLPDGSGIDLIGFRNERIPAARILVLTSSKNENDLVAAVEAGADSYVVKDAPPEQLLQAVRAALDGENFLTPGAAGILLKRLRQPEHHANEAQPALSAREKEILHHLAGGASSAEVAWALHITESTLRTHIQHILKKLGLQNRSQAVIYAVKNNL